MFGNFCKVSNRGENGYFLDFQKNRYIAYPKCCLFRILTGVYPIFTRFTRNAKRPQKPCFSHAKTQKRIPCKPGYLFRTFIRAFTRNGTSRSQVRFSFCLYYITDPLLQNDFIIFRAATGVMRGPLPLYTLWFAHSQNCNGILQYPPKSTQQAGSHIGIQMGVSWVCKIVKL